jgi:outer membrane protein
MRKTFAIAIMVIFATASLFSTQVFAQGLKVGFVDFAKFAQQSKKAQAMQKKLQNMFMKEREKLEKMQKDMVSLKEKIQKQGPMLTEAKRKEMIKKLGIMEMEFKLSEKEAQDRIQNAQRDQQKAFRDEISDVIKKIRQKQNYAIIFDSAALLSAADAFDITMQVVKLYDASPGPPPSPKPSRKRGPKPKN